MREILFRGKAINRIESASYRTSYKNGDWVYGLVTRLFDERFAELPAEMTNTNGVEGIEVDYKTVGQYTGLTDKNGVKIFEGDIVSGVAYSVNMIGVIVWIEEIASYGIRYKARKCPTACQNSSILTFKGNNEFKAEIIGNIHDNPELLKECL